MSTAPVIPGMNMPEADPLQMQDIQRQQLLKNVSNAAVGGQTAPQLAPQQAGGVKSYLGDLLYNIGEYTKKRYGLVTDYEKQQNAAQIGIAQQKANTEEGYKDLQGQAISGGLPSAVTQEQADMYKGFGVPVAVGTMLNPKQHVDLMKQALSNKGKKDVAEVNQGLQVPFPKELADRVGVPDMAGKPIGLKALNSLATYQGKNHQVTSVGDRLKLIDKTDGSEIADLGQNPQLAARVGSANAFAKARAAYTTVNFQDPETGEVRTGSALEALQSGQATVTKASGEKILSRTAVMNDIRASFKQLKDATGALDNASTTERLAINRVLRDSHSTVGSFMNSTILNELSPQLQEYVIQNLNTREQIFGLRKALGAGAGSDSQAAEMLRTLPTSEQGEIARRKIDVAEGVRGRLEEGIQKLGAAKATANPAKSKGGAIKIIRDASGKITGIE